MPLGYTKFDVIEVLRDRCPEKYSPNRANRSLLGSTPIGLLAPTVILMRLH